MMSYKTNEVKKTMKRKLRDMVEDKEGCFTITIVTTLATVVCIGIPTVILAWMMICIVPLGIIVDILGVTAPTTLAAPAARFASLIGGA